jgi:hypothetical protein
MHGRGLPSDGVPGTQEMLHFGGTMLSLVPHPEGGTFACQASLMSWFIGVLG